MQQQPHSDLSATGAHAWEPVRVAYVVYSFQAGGIERCVAHLSNRLDRSRFRPMIVCLSRTGNAAEWLARDDIRLFELRKKEGNDVRTVSRLARLLRRERVELVHSHNWGTLLESVFARKLARTPIHVHAERGMELEGLTASAARRTLRQRASSWAYRRASCVVTNCEAIRQRLAAECPRIERRVQVIPNGVASTASGQSGSDPASSLRSRQGIPETAVVIGSVGRLAAVKDFASLVRSVAMLRQRLPDVHLVIVGEGPERDNLQQLAQSLGIQERVHLVGWCKESSGWLQVMDVYANTSLNEGMSQSILEAMAEGLPAVVTDVGDSAALVGGDDACGLVVSAGDPRQAADALESLLTDSERMQRFRDSARRRHRADYSLDAMIGHYEALYSELLSGRRGPRSKARVWRNSSLSDLSVPSSRDAASVRELARP